MPGDLETDAKNVNNEEINLAKQTSILNQRNNPQNLYRLYKENLIRYEVVKKLNRELTFARASLEKAAKTQAPYLNKCRQRVDWLEKEIEKTF